MALVTSYDHDVFVSYVHADNTLSFGTEAALGWVTALVQNLNRGPNVPAKEILIDY